MQFSEQNSDTQDIVHGSDSLGGVFPYLVVEVDDRVGISAVGLVYHMLNVYIFCGYKVEYAVYHAGNIMVDDAQTAHAHTFKLC